MTDKSDKIILSLTRYWYNWVWLPTVPAFIAGLVALTCTDKKKMAFLWAVGCLIVSTLVIFWSGALLAICNQMCTCQWFDDKRIHYDQVGEY